VLEKPKMIQGVFPVTGKGLEHPISFNPEISYVVPFDKRAQLTYFRAGNPSPELIYVLFKRNHLPMRYFPVGARDSVHISLAVLEDLHPETLIEVLVAAPEGLATVVVLDIGFVEF